YADENIFERRLVPEHEELDHNHELSVTQERFASEATVDRLKEETAHVTKVTKGRLEKAAKKAINHAINHPEVNKNYNKKRGWF
ncbi:hypothetical protein BGZ96_001699, partial [Linnemannia gamsii]